MRGLYEVNQRLTGIDPYGRRVNPYDSRFLTPANPAKPWMVAGRALSTPFAPASLPPEVMAQMQGIVDQGMERMMTKHGARGVAYGN